MSEIEALRAQKDAAYSERNRCVVALVRMALAMGCRAGTAEHPSDDAAWESDWRALVYIDFPAGQVSWHFHDTERPRLEEREACAVLVEDTDVEVYSRHSYEESDDARATLRNAAKAIRARTLP